MVRIILGVVGGYLAMAVLVMVLFSMLYLIMGPERAFQPGSTDVTPLWLGLALAASALAAGVGGRLAAIISQRNEAVVALAGAVLLLGLYTAWSNAGVPPPEAVNLDDVGMFEVARQARQPDWYAWTLPFVAAACVWLAGMNPRK